MKKFCIYFILSFFITTVSSYGSDYRFFAEVKSHFNVDFQNPQSVYIDSINKELYIADRDLNAIFVFNEEFHPLFSIGNDKGIREPIFIKGYKNRLYIIEAVSNFVKVLNYRGQEVLQLKAPQDIKFSPQKLEIGTDELIYVTNSADNSCLVFDLKGNYIRTLVKDLYSLSGLALKDEKVFLISPYGTNNIKVYNNKGDFLFSFEGIQDYGGTLQLPVEGKFFNDNLYILDSMQGVVVYNKELKRIAQIGKYGLKSMQLRFPVDIDLDSNGMVYLIDEYRKSLMIYKVINED